MNVVYSILQSLLILILTVIVFLFIYFIFATTKALFKYPYKYADLQIPFTLKNFFNYTVSPCLLEHKYIKIIDFVKWVTVDIFRGKDKLRLWGIWAFTGYYGQGKTMGCVQFAKHLQKTYPHRDIKIYSNIDVDGQVKRITSWEELLNLPPNSIMIYDESQADWSCNIGTNSFPEDFLRRITQCRKKQFAMFMTSPKFNRMNINLRESVNFVIECKNILDFDRWFKYDFYHSEDYENYHENKIKLALNKYLSMSFVVSDNDYKLYNTIEEVESIKKENVDVKLKKNDAAMLQGVLKNFRNEVYKTMESEIKSLKLLISKK